MEQPRPIRRSGDWDDGLGAPVWQAVGRIDQGKTVEKPGVVQEIGELIMKQIKKLKIGGHFVKVIWEDEIPNMGYNMGDSWNAHNSIRVSTHFPESQQEETLLHEILHHIMNNLGHKHKCNDGIHTEQNVEALAQGLYQVLKDNKLVF